MTWAWLVAFLLLQVAIALWASRRVHDESDYFVAGRRLGAPIVALSLFATWFGAETCLGASGAVFRDGLAGARADPLGYAACLVLMGVLLARRFSEGRFLTLGDLYRRRWGPRTEQLAVLVILPSSLLWGAAQIRAFGQVLGQTASVSVEAGILVSAVLVVFYSFVGGAMGDIVTDTVQGLILATGLIVLGVAVAVAPPPQAAMQAALSPERLALVPAGESVWVQLDRWSVPILGSLVAQELLARVLAARDGGTARRASFAAAGIYLAVGAIPIALGLLGPALVPGLEDAEALLPALARERLPHAAYMVFSCALLAAILSTIDSILLASSALVSHNLLVPALRLEREEQKLRAGRLVVVAAGAFAYLVALHAERIYDLVEVASAVGTAGVLVTTLAALYWRRGDARAATAALVLGLVTTPIAEQLELPAPFLTSVAVSALAYVLAAWRWPDAGETTQAQALAP